MYILQKHVPYLGADTPLYAGKTPNGSPFTTTTIARAKKHRYWLAAAFYNLRFQGRIIKLQPSC